MSVNTASPEYRAALNCVRHDSLFGIVAQRVDELEDWKRSAMEVMNRMNLQAVGVALGIGLGLDVADKVLPGIHNLQARVKELEVDLARTKNHAMAMAHAADNEKAERLRLRASNDELVKDLRAALATLEMEDIRQGVQQRFRATLAKHGGNPS